MTTADFADQLDEDFGWRFDEIRCLKNLLTLEPDPDARDLLRKSLVVLLYSHFEGFCVFALEHYLRAVNEARLACGEAVASIIAGSWEPVFTAMETGDEKCKLFLRPLPNDPRLHRHWRRRHFVEEIDRLWKLPVEIREDTIDSESNLKPEVLQRNLFLLGLDYQFVEPHADALKRLLKRRNNIAHGDQRRGMAEAEYQEFEGAVLNICQELREFLVLAHREAAYRNSDNFKTVEGSGEGI